MLLKIENLHKTIKGAKVLEGIDLSMEGGHIYGFRGPNGSGKTMLMRAVCGLIRPTDGAVYIDNKTVGQDIAFPPSVGALIETPSFISKYTGYQNLKYLAMIRKRIGAAEIRSALEDVGLMADDRRTYRKYSLGMKQRLGIAAALMERPELILLDEPINALDEKGIALVRHLLSEKRREGALIILACHDLQELELLADEVFEMADGKIVNHYKVQCEQ
jgi:ABC-2 type transport system ATP-binding protein